MRVASLLPAATEIVAAIGGVGLLVAVSHECDFPAPVRSLPRVTRSRLDDGLTAREIDGRMAEAKRSGVLPIEVDTTALWSLRPDLLIGQSLCSVCAVDGTELVRVAASLNPAPQVLTLHAHTLDEVWGDIERVGGAIGLGAQANALVSVLRVRLNELRSYGQRPMAHATRVLVLEWLDPPYVAGHWVPELIALAGGEDVGGIAAGRPSVARPWVELARLAPDLVIVALCGFDAARGRREAAQVTDPDGRALLDGHVEFLDGNAYTSRPGPRLADAAEILTELIHG
jgi:iron complex transport system substrate-binding protein